MEWSKDLFKGSPGEHMACGIIYGILVLLLTVNLSSHLNNTGRGDWDQFYFYNEVPQITIFQYHQFPLWNPYACGGMPMLANPQSRFLSPSLVFSSLFGVVVGMKLELIFGLFIGMMGMYFLGRYLKMSWPAALLPGVIFGLNGTFALHLTEGHFHFLPAFYFPFVFLFFLRSIEDSRFVLISGLFAGLSFLEGGTYVTLFFMIFILFFSLIKAVQIKSIKPIGLFFIFFLSILFWAAPKIFPTIEFLVNHHRPTVPGGYIPISFLKDMFLSPYQGIFPADIKEYSNDIGWWEVGAYLGIGVLIIYLLSFFYAFDQYPILFSGLLCLILCLGNFAPFSLWNLLHKLQPFSNMLIPTRMLLIFIFSLSLMCGFVLDRFLKDLPWRNVFNFMIILSIAINLLCVGNVIFSDVIRGQIIDQKDQPRLFHAHLDDLKSFKQTFVPRNEWFWNGARSTLHHSVLNNEGVVNAYESVPVQDHAVPDSSKAYKGEYYLIRQGVAKLLKWSPNEIGFLVDSSVDNKLVINQNYDKNWKIREGLDTRSYNGLLSVDLKEGQNKITFSYQPVSFMIGCLFFMIAVVATVYLMAGKGVIFDHANEKALG